MKYTDRVLGFVDVAQLDPMKIVINSGNGAAGPTIDAIIKILEGQGSPIEFIRVNHEPDSTFPNGIPNSLLSKNRKATADVVLRERADLGVVFMVILTAAFSLMKWDNLYRVIIW